MIAREKVSSLYSGILVAVLELETWTLAIFSLLKDIELLLSSLAGIVSNNFCSPQPIGFVMVGFIVLYLMLFILAILYIILCNNDIVRRRYRY